MADGTTASTVQGPTITVAELLRTAERLGAMPKGKWMLVAPDGRVWADEEIGPIARAAALEALRDAPGVPTSAQPDREQRLAAAFVRLLDAYEAGTDNVPDDRPAWVRDALALARGVALPDGGQHG